MPERYSELLGELKGKKLKTARGWALKEAIRGLWKCSTEKEGQVFFEEWYSWAIRSRLEPIKKVARMMKRHLPNIVSYFRHRITNAALEGINNKIQSLIKKAYGYRNKDRFKNDILFHCGGLNLYPVETFFRQAIHSHRHHLTRPSLLPQHVHTNTPLAA